MIRELFESELSKEIKKSEQANKVKDVDRKENDDDKMDKDIKAAEIEKRDTEPNKPKKSTPSQAELMAQNPEALDGEDEVDMKDTAVDGEPDVDPADANNDEEESEKKKKNEDFMKSIDSILK